MKRGIVLSAREEIILSNEFFVNKQDLAKQIIDFEKNGRGFLPNQPERSHLEFSLNGKNIILGKIHNFYYLGIGNPETDEWNYDAFYNKSNCIQFFVNNFEKIKENSEEAEHDEVNRQKAFWLNQIERI